MKKFRSKWFRIAVEGATTDGRNIERDWIEQMAAQYDPNTYGARINCEHIKWAWPAGEFGAYGDVLACKAEEIDINGQKKLALFAQLEPNQALLELNKQRQKVYTSVEIDPKFADTGKAYLVGLAITDSPASLGTEALSFSAKNGTLASRKTNPDTLFSAAEEGTLEFEEYEEKPSVGAALVHQGQGTAQGQGSPHPSRVRPGRRGRRSDRRTQPRPGRATRRAEEADPATGQPAGQGHQGTGGPQEHPR
ncbi:putative capsid scafolding protein [Pseudomonas aeruginosa]|nr:putative capsid scafolding protein [Pseudomonas aeruginosa]